jgi:hypothetical protein
LAICAGLCIATAAIAQSSAAPRNLVNASTDSGKRYILADHRAAWATAQTDRGAVPGDLPLQHLSIALNRSAERQQALEQLLKEQQDPASPNYHRWLSPLEVGAQFGASQHDIDAVSAWLTAQGLHVDNVANSRTRITFSGTAATVGKAFATSMRYYQVSARTRIANADDPQIPAALADVVQSVSGLHAVGHRPQHHTGTPRQLQARALQAQGISDRPADTFCPPGGACEYTIFPADFAKIYSIDALAGQGIDGSGQTIAIVGNARVSNPDISNFQQRSGLATKYPIVTVPPDGSDPGAPATTCSDSGFSGTCSNPSDAVEAQSEATIDVERAASVAPGATINLIVSADTHSVDGVQIAMEYAIDTNPVPAKILNISFASCEADNGSAVTRSLDQQLFQPAAAEGISVFVASGDGGVAGCAALDATPDATPAESINALCASGSVTCVGGTEFADAANPGAYWAAQSGAYGLSALGYIPEGAWNDPLSTAGTPQFSASGGGISSFIATPSWQTGPGVPDKQGRYTPDVAFAASAAHDGYLTCVAALGGSCVSDSSGNYFLIPSGGTSASTPGMAGIAALLNQKTGSAQGNLNPRLYALAATPGSGVFHDVTVSSSAVVGCTAAAPSLCNNSTPGSGGLFGGLGGYLVTDGYDLATGLGSINATNLLAQWGGTSSGSALNLDQHGLTGSWYNQQTSGQGLLIETYRDISGAGQGVLAAGWYTFDVTAPGGQRWYTLQGPALSGAAFAPLGIYAATGGNFNAAPAVASSLVGSATLSFSDCTHGSLSYSFSDGSGRAGTIALIRIDQNVTCSTAGDSGGAPADYLLSGAWYNRNTSGQGFFFDVNPTQTTLFAAWYTFAQGGAAIGGGASQSWYTIQTNAFVPGATTANNVPIYAPTGGVFNTPGVVTNPKVGTANISFQNCGAVTLSYAFTAGANTGQNGTLNLTRVGPTPSGCDAWFPTQ